MATFGQHFANAAYQGLKWLTASLPFPESVPDFFRSRSDKLKEEMARYDQREFESDTLSKKLEAQVKSKEIVEKEKASSFATIIAQTTGQEVASGKKEVALQIETESAKKQAKSAEQHAKLHTEKLGHLQGIEKAQETSKEKQQESSKLEVKIDQTRIDMAKAGEEAAIAHGKAIERAQKHEEGGVKATMGTAVAETRHAFALQIIETLARLEMQKMAYQNQLDNQKLSHQGELDKTTADKRLVLEKQVSEANAAKTQYLDGLKTKLGVTELKQLSELIADQMTAKSFAKQQEDRATIRPQTAEAAVKGAEFAEKGRQSEVKTAQVMSKNEGQEQAARALISETLEKSESFRTSLAELPILFAETAQAKVQDKMAQKNGEAQVKHDVAANDNDSEKSYSMSGR